MKALFVWPRIPFTYWGAQYSIKLLGKRAVMPPLGLLTVAALCPQNWEMRLVDLNIEELDQADIEWADLVFMSGMGIQHRSMTETIDRCKALKKPVVVGGPHATSSREKFPDASHLILDEAEITLPPFLADLENGTPQRVYTAKGEKPDVTLTPVPRYDLLDIKAYTHMCVQFSRGCPFACEFCDITTLYGKKPRTKNPNQITHELQRIYDLDFRGEVFLVDDNFIGNKRDVKLMLPNLIAWQKEHGYPFWLYTEASLNLADDGELLEMMCDAGFHSVFIGIESPSLESLRETQKYQNIQGDMLSKVHLIQSYGLEVMAGFIVGFDNDGEDIFERQIEFITKAKIPMAMVGALNAMPSTQLWNRLKLEGRLNAEFTGDNLDVPNFETKLPALTLMRGYRTVLSTIYTPENLFGRLRELFDALGARNKTQGRLGLSAQLRWVPLLAPALFQLTVFDRDKEHYRRFLGWAIKNHPDKWMYAMIRAVIAHHFIRYTSDVMVPRLTLLESQLEEKELSRQALAS